MEIRLHGRGGQGGVTCAKILAAFYARMGKSVQAFGDYAGERSGAPLRAYTRVSDQPVINRNKVYRPDHLLVLDPSLLTDDTVAGLAAGGTLVVNSPEPPQAFDQRFPGFRVATVDATRIARQHGIGTRSVVIVNTAIAGAFVKALGLPLNLLEEVYGALGFGASNVEAARQAYESVQVGQSGTGRAAASAGALATGKAVVDLVTHTEGPETGLRTGSWRTRMPRYLTGTAPCVAGCPAGNDVVGFVQALYRDDLQQAATILAKSSPLPGVCGRVCPGFCMDACNRRHHDGAVNIRGLERWVADHAPAIEVQQLEPSQVKRFAIVGSGPAGLGAAYHLAVLGHQATLFEAETTLGGVLRTGIPTYRLPRAVLDREIERILALGVQVECGQFLAPKRLAGLAREFDAVIVALGLQRLRGLDVQGAELSGVEQGIHFLMRANREQNARLSGHVVVLGGGNTALDCARTALRNGADKVTIAYRRTRAEMPAIHEEVDEAIEEGVALLVQRSPAAFHGQGAVQAIELAEVEMGPPDESGRRRPVVTSRTERLQCDAVLLALGQSADWSQLPEGWEHKEGRMWEGDQALHVFAAGDLATGEGTVTHAIGDGRRAACRALSALGQEAQPFMRPSMSEAVTEDKVRPVHFDRREMAPILSEAPSARIGDFREVNQGLASREEAARCFSCGLCTECDTCLVFCPEGIIRRGSNGNGYQVDLDYCKGCGLCVAECPRGAMEMITP